MLSLAPMCWRRGKGKETTEAEGANIFWRSTLFSSYRSSFSTGVPPVSLHLRAKSLALLGCAPKRAFCEADVPEGTRSGPLGLGAVPAPRGGLTFAQGAECVPGVLDGAVSIKRPAAPLLSKTSHRDVFDGQPARPPGTGPSGFSAPNGYRRLSPKDPPPLVQGAALGMGRKASTFLFFLQKERWSQSKMRPSEKCFARCDGRPGLCPWTPPPFEKGGRKLYWPSALLA